MGSSQAGGVKPVGDGFAGPVGNDWDLILVSALGHRGMSPDSLLYLYLLLGAAAPLALLTWPSGNLSQAGRPSPHADPPTLRLVGNLDSKAILLHTTAQNSLGKCIRSQSQTCISLPFATGSFAESVRTSWESWRSITRLVVLSRTLLLKYCESESPLQHRRVTRF